MKRVAVIAFAGALFLAAPASVAAQEHQMQEVQAVAETPAPPVAEATDAAETEAETPLETLRRAEAEYTLTGEDIREIAVDSELEGAAAEDTVVISTTAIIIGLLVLILIT